jgi:hypothetical protein
MFFPYYGFEWIQPLPGNWMYLPFILLAVSALGVTLGYKYRLSITVYFVVFTYIELLDKTMYLNHYYLVSLLAFLLIWMPLGKIWALDADKTQDNEHTVPAWMLWAIRGQVGLVYFFAGVAKLNPDWVCQGEPLRTWLLARTDFPLLGTLFAQPFTPYLGSIAAAIFDLSVPFLLLWKPSRKYAYFAIVAFHVLTWMMFPIGIFPWLMIANALIFFPPRWPLKWFPSSHSATRPPIDKAHSPKWLISLFAIHFSIQIALPFRAHLYPGNHLWHEQGFRFSWKVMLIEKSGHTEFHLTDPVSKKKWTIHPANQLTRLQVKMMNTQPDMILQFAHRLAAQWRRKGYPQIQVRVHAFAALNGRPAQQLINPRQDLAKIPQGFGHKEWITPLKKMNRPIHK